MKVEIGPMDDLVAPRAILSEMHRWYETYYRLINIYLKGDEIYSSKGVRLTPEYSCMPLSNDYQKQRDYLLPASIELDDPRPVLTHADGALRAIARRRVYHVVNFVVAPDTDDRVILRSAFGNLAEHLSAQLGEWYNKSRIPLRRDQKWPSPAGFNQLVQEQKKRLGL